MNCTRRAALAVTSAWPFVLSACGRPATSRSAAAPSATPRPSPWSAVVDIGYTGADGATVHGLKTYKTVAAALKDAPAASTTPYVISLKPGRYREKLAITKPFVAFVGESQESTVLAFDDAADTKTPGGGTYGTAGSASVTVSARDFRAEHLTIENAFDYLGNRAKAADDPAKVANAQAVALRLDRGSDRAVFRNVTLRGYQDTLLADAGRSCFQRCAIAGSTDFIFGAGRAVFDDCDIVSRDLGSATNNGYITAASTPLSQPYGFLFLNCRLKKERPAMADGTVALGRPWHPGGDPNAVAGVAFVNCYMEGHISERGWEAMSSRDKEGQTIWFYPKDSRFYEFGSAGPGAHHNDARAVLPESEAQRYTIANVLDGWDPRQGSSQG